MLVTEKKIGRPDSAEYIQKAFDILNTMTTYLKIAMAAVSYNILAMLRKIYPKNQSAKIDPFQSLPHQCRAN